MPCEIVECCQLINELMQALPKVAHFHKQRVCLDDCGCCSWYQTYRNAACGQLRQEFPLSPEMQQELEKIMRCLHQKMEQSVEHAEPDSAAGVE